MKINKKETIIDDKIDKQIKDYGVVRLAEKIDVYPQYIYLCLNKKFQMSWKVYQKIRDILIEENIKLVEEELNV